MSAGASERRDEFLERLLELELDARTLRQDPSIWLPPDMLELVREDSGCAEELREFIDLELGMFDAVAVQEPTDAFFTKRVMDALPPIETVDDNRRTWILASAYALAIGVAYLLLGPLLSSGELSEWFAPLRGWVDDHALEAGSMWLPVSLLIAAAALVLLPVGRGGGREADA